MALGSSLATVCYFGAVGAENAVAGAD
jgi:hypothetical protein